MLGPSWAYIGPGWAYVGLCWAHLGAMLGLCWAHVGLCWAYVLAHVEPYNLRLLPKASGKDTGCGPLASALIALAD